MGTGKGDQPEVEGGTDQEHLVATIPVHVEALDALGAKQPWQDVLGEALRSVFELQPGVVSEHPLEHSPLCLAGADEPDAGQNQHRGHPDETHHEAWQPHHVSGVGEHGVGGGQSAIDVEERQCFLHGSGLGSGDGRGILSRLEAWMDRPRWSVGIRGLALRVSLVLVWIGCQRAPAPDGPPPSPAPTLSERHRAVTDEIAALVADLSAAGTYQCCIQTPCRWCAMQTAGCACGPGLVRGEPVCEECALMWTKGQGSIPGVDPDGVRSFLEAMRADPWCGREAPEN